MLLEWAKDGRPRAGGMTIATSSGVIVIRTICSDFWHSNPGPVRSSCSNAM
jgi:hypothetical protein